MSASEAHDQTVPSLRVTYTVEYVDPIVVTSIDQMGCPAVFQSLQVLAVPTCGASAKQPMPIACSREHKRNWSEHAEQA